MKTLTDWLKYWFKRLSKCLLDLSAKKDKKKSFKLIVLTENGQYLIRNKCIDVGYKL